MEEQTESTLIWSFCTLRDKHKATRSLKLAFDGAVALLKGSCVQQSPGDGRTANAAVAQAGAQLGQVEKSSWSVLMTEIVPCRGDVRELGYHTRRMV